MLSAIASVPLPGRLPQNFHSPKENVPSAQIAIRFIKSYHVQTQEAAQASQRFRVSEKCKIRKIGQFLLSVHPVLERASLLGVWVNIQTYSLCQSRTGWETSSSTRRSSTKSEPRGAI